MGAVTYFVRMVAKEGKAEEVQQLLLENPRRIEQGEPGNLAFGMHRSIDNPNEFWLYETWASEEAVQAHESGAAFQRYKQALRPLVDPGSLLFGTASRSKFSATASSPRQRPALHRANRDHQGANALRRAFAWSGLATQTHAQARHPATRPLVSASVVRGYDGEGGSGPTTPHSYMKRSE